MATLASAFNPMHRQLHQMGVQPRTPFALLPHSLSLARELIKNSKYVSNLICAFISLCMCTCVCVCEAPLIAGQGVRKGCSHLIFPLWSLNMYKPEVGYVSVPTPHKHASVCNCACVCVIFRLKIHALCYSINTSALSPDTVPHPSENSAPCSG